jgi:thioredoxin-like negative regulator of GroEL
VAGVVVVALMYTLHVPNMQAAGDIIDSYRSRDPQVQLEAFRRALSRDSFARQEIVEQLAQQAMNVAGSDQVPPEIRQEFVTVADTELQALAAAKPNDARIHVFMGTFYRATGQPEKARAEMARARELSPKKQAIILQQGIIEFTLGDTALARDYFREAFELDERNPEARDLYATALFHNLEPEAARALIIDDATKARFARNDFLVNGVNVAGDLPLLAELYQIRIADNPTDPQQRTSLAFVYFQQNDKERAVAVLAEAATAIPSFASTATCFSENIKAGRSPEEGCS